MQQSRLVGIAPGFAAATVALNTSAVYLGQSVGAATGGFAIRESISASVVWMALVFLVLAIVMSVAATRLTHRALR